MKNAKTKNIRLYIDSKKQGVDKIVGGSKLEVTEQDFLYLTKVMRLNLGDKILIFNGYDGEFCAKISEINKKNLVVKVIEKTNDLTIPANITLAFALIKNTKNELIATKAAELGISCLQPLTTAHTIVDKINSERMFLAIKEAYEALRC